MITSRKHKHVPILRRQREQKTNYRKRKSAIICSERLLVVRISNIQTIIQFIVPRMKGDIVKSSTNSSHLKSLGWEYSGKNMPGAYLTGYLAGKKAMKSGIKSSILYLGVSSFKPKSRTFSAVKGLIDAGVIVRLVRSSMLEILREDYITVAYAKGCLLYTSPSPRDRG